MNMNHHLCKNLILLILLILITSSCNSTKEAIYLIPDGYTGAVVILFEQPDGVTLPVEDGFNVYKIPENGVLKVKTQAIYDIDEESFFYEDSNRERIRIEYLYPSSQRGQIYKERKTFDEVSADDPTMYAMGSEMGSFNSSKGTVRFRSLGIGRASESAKIYQQKRSKIVEIQKILR